MKRYSFMGIKPIVIPSSPDPLTIQCLLQIAKEFHSEQIMNKINEIIILFFRL